MLVNMNEVLAAVQTRGCCVGAFDTPNLEILMAVIRAAEKRNEPVIIQHAQLHEPEMALRVIGPIMVRMAKESTVPVCVMLDHGEDLDHKRAGDGDQGLNTGGMGTFSPSPFYTEEVDAFCRKYIYQPTVDAMKAEGREFKGIIFFGLMLTDKGPKVLEYNARFGDPETQVVLPRMKNDIIDVFQACVDGTLDQIELEFEDNAAVCVVLASAGYPEHYEKGYKMTGFENFEGRDGYYVFHAGSKFDKDGNIVTNGGRVLGVTAKGKTLKEARENAYRAAEWIEFGNKYMRHDIGKAIDEV